MNTSGDDGEFATKAEVQAIRADLQRLMAIQEGRVRGAMSRMEAELDAKIDAGRNEAISQINVFAGKLQIYARESVTMPHSLDRHARKLRNHEERLKRLESRRKES